MKAAHLTNYGGHDAISHHTDAPEPTIKPNQVLVKVSYAALNPFDWKVREGVYQSMKQLEFPSVLGGDLAGEVVAVGDEATGFSVGQKVFGSANSLSGNGALAELAPVAAKQLHILPAGIDEQTAAASVLVACSAYQALVETMELGNGQTILIHGGAGGIGSAAIQIAKSLGASVTTTVQSSDEAYVRELGADEVIDYGSQDFSAQGNEYDCVFDTVGGETLEKSVTVVKPGGILISMAGEVGKEAAEARGIRTVYQFSSATNERLDAVAEMLLDGRLTIKIDQVFPLSEASAAFERLKTGHPRGKILVSMN